MSNYSHGNKINTNLVTRRLFTRHAWKFSVANSITHASCLLFTDIFQVPSLIRRLLLRVHYLSISRYQENISRSLHGKGVTSPKGLQKGTGNN